MHDLFCIILEFMYTSLESSVCINKEIVDLRCNVTYAYTYLFCIILDYIYLGAVICRGKQFPGRKFEFPDYFLIGNFAGKPY